MLRTLKLLAADAVRKKLESWKSALILGADQISLLPLEMRDLIKESEILEISKLKIVSKFVEQFRNAEKKCEEIMKKEGTPGYIIWDFDMKNSKIPGERIVHAEEWSNKLYYKNNIMKGNTNVFKNDILKDWKLEILKHYMF
jgi:hypothetical protein